ncbi:MAG: hypothetical protein RLZZ245_3911 [Verrucomicrobiota bacterium]|jgi:hypothetical protein
MFNSLLLTSILRWIPVADELPDDDQTVLIADSESEVEIGFLDGPNGWRLANGARVPAPVTHWAELPEPPHLAASGISPPPTDASLS